MKFTKWLDTFIEEKGIDQTEVFEVEGATYGTNYIPLGVVVEHMKIAPPAEQAAIKRTIVKIDFLNQNPVPFFKHLAKAIAQ
jgi:hypothetical protein